MYIFRPRRFHRSIECAISNLRASERFTDVGIRIFHSVGSLVHCPRATYIHLSLVRFTAFATATRFLPGIFRGSGAAALTRGGVALAAFLAAAVALFARATVVAAVAVFVATSSHHFGFAVLTVGGFCLGCETADVNKSQHQNQPTK